MAVVCGWLLLHLSACASISGSAKFNHSMPRPGRAAVYVGRPDGSNVTHMPLRMELDGRPLAQLGVDTYTRIELLPGTYKLAAADNYLTSVTHGRLRPLTLKVEAGRSYFVLPTPPVGNVRPPARIAGNSIAPAETGGAYGGFTVQRGHPPAAFADLSYVLPDAAGD